MLPLRGEATKLNRDIQGVGSKDEVFYYLRHDRDMVIVTRKPNQPPEIQIRIEDVRWEPGDNDEDDW